MDSEADKIAEVKKIETYCKSCKRWHEFERTGDSELWVSSCCRQKLNDSQVKIYNQL